MTPTQNYDIISPCTPILSADPNAKEDVMDQQKITIIYPIALKPTTIPSLNFSKYYPLHISCLS